ncbi:MAG TPA: hypothetical protein VGI88_06295, partial [Verrucomicrobiae bacterium]
ETGRIRFGVKTAGFMRSAGCQPAVSPTASRQGVIIADALEFTCVLRISIPGFAQPPPQP